ncbi:hypothetical protein GOV10_06985, partial [Candidatus Woesearchaeota archaeon]|nr:hypothetical protein [Candidatus Woesearchaeota archaeon]
MGNSKTALDWLWKELEMKDWESGNLEGDTYNRALQAKLEAFLKTGAKKEHHKGLREVIKQNVSDRRHSDKNLSDEWKQVREIIRKTPTHKKEQEQKQANRILREQGGDYKKALNELNKMGVSSKIKEQFEKKIHEQRKAFFNSASEEIKNADTKAEVKKLKDTVLFELQKEKSKPTNERLLKETTINTLIKRYQDKRKEYFVPQGKGVEAARIGIVKDYESTDKTPPKAARVDRKVEEVLDEQPWLGKRAARTVAKDILRREERVKDYAEARSKREQGEITAYDLVMESYARQNKDPVNSLFDKENLLRQYETKGGRAIKAPRISRVTRTDTPALVASVRERLKREVAEDRVLYDDYKKNITFTTLKPLRQQQAVSPIIQGDE